MRLMVSTKELQKINKYLTEEPKGSEECLGENGTISYTVKFFDGKEMDIKCCGVEYREGESNKAWAEAILFSENGGEINITEPNSVFEGVWTIENGDFVYSVEVVDGGEEPTHSVNTSTVAKVEFKSDTFPIIIFQKELDETDVNRIVGIFKQWFVDEINKRLIKNGKLFNFTFVEGNDDESSCSLVFGNHKNGKYVTVMEGCYWDIMLYQKSHKYYKQIVEQALAIANQLVDEYGLTKNILPTDGRAKCYEISKTA